MNYPSAAIAHSWTCSSCGTVKDPVNEFDPSWRFVSDYWQHKCPDIPPQCGHFMARPNGEVVDHYLWQVDGGNTWWVIAADESDALALVIEMEELGGHLVVQDEWDPEGWPTPKKLTYDEAGHVRIYDEMHDMKLSLMMEFTINPKRRAVGCSEY